MKDREAFLMGRIYANLTAGRVDEAINIIVTRIDSGYPQINHINKIREEAKTIFHIMAYIEKQFPRESGLTRLSPKSRFRRMHCVRCMSERLVKKQFDDGDMTRIELDCGHIITF